MLAKWSALGIGTIVVVGVVVGAGAFMYHEYENRPTKQTSYYGFSLGMNKQTALYVGGAPNYVGYMRPNQSKGPVTLPGGLPSSPYVTYANGNIPSGKSFLSSSRWDYDANSFAVTVSFDPKTGKITKIDCFDGSEDGLCRPVLGIGTHASEKAVLKRLGQPDQESIHNGIKTMNYNKLNLALQLDKNGVFEISVADKAQSATR